MSLFRPLLALCVLIAAAACGKHSPTDPGQEIIKHTLKCTEPGAGSNTIACDVPIPPSAAKLRITLVSHDCAAPGDIISVATPTAVTLTTDACYAPLNTSIDVPGPFTGATLSLQVTSELIKNPPELRIGGNASPWTIYFEDGGDQDFNDAVLKVEAL